VTVDSLDMSECEPQFLVGETIVVIAYSDRPRGLIREARLRAESLTAGWQYRVIEVGPVVWTNRRIGITGSWFNESDLDPLPTLERLAQL
jgi:hypothetical protein